MITRQVTRNNRKFMYEVTVSQSGKFVSIFPAKSKRPLWGMIFPQNETLENIHDWVLTKVDPKK